VRIVAAEFELLDDVAHLLESLLVLVSLGIEVRHYQEGRLLKQDNFVCIYVHAECLQALLQSFHVWKHEVHYL
jgi:hypothetical protein